MLYFYILASFKGFNTIVQLLLEYEADVNMRDKSDQTALLLGFYFLLFILKLAKFFMAHILDFKRIGLKKLTPNYLSNLFFIFNLASKNYQISTVELLTIFGASK